MTDTLVGKSPAMDGAHGIGARGALTPSMGTAAAPRFLPVLTILFVGSGCAALIYEIVWLQLLGLVIGVSAISLGVLLGTFMGGMCIGSLLFPRLVSRRLHPLMVYGILELAIGVIGILELAIVPFVSDFYVHMAASGTASVMLRAMLAGFCLLPPTILMGATLPAIARWVEATPKGVSWLGFFYGGNILGAVIGCLAAGFYLLPNFDMKTATLIAAAINALVAGLGILLSLITKHEVSREEVAAETMLTPAQEASLAVDRWTIYGAIALSGLTGLAAEVIWTRLLSLMLGATVYTFSIILAVFLAGLGMGSSVGSFIARSSESPRWALALCQLMLAAAVAWASYAISNSLPFWPMLPWLAVSPWYTFQSDLARVCWAVLPGAVLWGASFPLALGSLAKKGQDAGKLVGGVYAANTVGAIVGSLAFSMWLIPAMGTQGSQRLVVILSAVAAVVALLPMLIRERQPGETGHEMAGLSVAMVLGIAGAFWLMLGISPPNWASIAWGRNSANEIAGGAADPQGYRYPIFPAVLDSDEDAQTLREAKGRPLASMELRNGKVWVDWTGIDDTTRNDNLAWITAHNDRLISIMSKRQAITGVGNLLAYKIPGAEKEDWASRYCTFIGEGRNVSVAVTVDDYGYRYFHGAGKVQASSNPTDMRLQRMLGHISALMKPDAKDVLVVACGAGVTAGSFVPYESNIQIVDIEPMVPRYVTPQFWQENHNVIPSGAPWYGHEGGYAKTSIQIDDGRHFIKTTPRKFDIITSDPIDPWVKGCAALNTVEYYQACKEHLKPGGVVALWIPLYESTEDTAKSVICTFFKVFPNGILWSNEDNRQGYDAVLFAKVGEDGGVDQPPKVDLDAIQDYIEKHPKVKASIDQVNFDALHSVVPGLAGDCEAVQLFSTFAGTAPDMKAWSADTERLINYDSNLRLQYVAGMGVNEYQAPKILANILKNYKFPDRIFSGSPERMAALKEIFQATGRK